MKMHLKKAVIGSLVSVMCLSGIAAASGPAVGVDVVTPNVRVQVGNPAPPPSIAVVEREHVIVRERGRHHDNGRHRGHYKKHRGHKNHDYWR